MATIIGAVIVFGIVGAVTVKLISDRVHHKGGCRSCGGDCSACAGGCRPHGDADA